MPAAYVKPYVKRGKNGSVDAEAICKAVARPTMRFVSVRSAEQQSIRTLHWTQPAWPLALAEKALSEVLSSNAATFSWRN